MKLVMGIAFLTKLSWLIKTFRQVNSRLGIKTITLVLKTGIIFFAKY